MYRDFSISLNYVDYLFLRLQTRDEQRFQAEEDSR